jgi:hypothetical protein
MLLTTIHRFDVYSATSDVQESTPDVDICIDSTHSRNRHSVSFLCTLTRLEAGYICDLAVYCHLYCLARVHYLRTCPRTAGSPNGMAGCRVRVAGPRYVFCIAHLPGQVLILICSHYGIRILFFVDTPSLHVTQRHFTAHLNRQNTALALLPYHLLHKRRCSCRRLDPFYHLCCLPGQSSYCEYSPLLTYTFVFILSVLSFFVADYPSKL